MARIYRVGFAHAEVGALFGRRRSILGPLRESWPAGAEVTRYGWTWVLSRLDFPHTGIAYAHIGFVREGEVRTLGFDRERLDFVRDRASSGVVVPLAINVNDGLMAVQLAPPVRVCSVTAAVQSALNARRTYSWTISELARRVPYQSWIDSVQRVTDFRFRIERPNPHWPEEGVARALLDAMRLEVASLTGRGEDINTTDEAFTNLLNHVSEQYGSGTLVGKDTDGEQVEWRTIQGGIVPAVRRVTSEREDEILEDDLVRELYSEQDTYVEVVGDDDESDTFDEFR